MYSLYFITLQRSGTRPVTKPLCSIRPEHRGTVHTQFWFGTIYIYAINGTCIWPRAYYVHIYIYIYRDIYIYILYIYKSHITHRCRVAKLDENSEKVGVCFAGRRIEELWMLKAPRVSHCDCLCGSTLMSSSSASITGRFPGPVLSETRDPTRWFNWHYV